MRMALSRFAFDTKIGNTPSEVTLAIPDLGSAMVTVDDTVQQVTGKIAVDSFGQITIQDDQSGEVYEILTSQIINQVQLVTFATTDSNGQLSPGVDARSQIRNSAFLLYSQPPLSHQLCARRTSKGDSPVTNTSANTACKIANMPCHMVTVCGIPATVVSG